MLFLSEGAARGAGLRSRTPRGHRHHRHLSALLLPGSRRSAKQARQRIIMSQQLKHSAWRRRGTANEQRPDAAPSDISPRHRTTSATFFYLVQYTSRANLYTRRNRQRPNGAHTHRESRSVSSDPQNGSGCSTRQSGPVNTTRATNIRCRHS